MHVFSDPSSPSAPFSSPASERLRSPQPPASQRGLMVMGALQGLALFAVMEWGDGLFGAVDRSWLALLMLLVVQVPLFMGMAVSRWHQPALWAGGAVMALVVLLMAGWTLWRNTHSDVGYEGALLRLGVAMALWWFVALAWFQAYLEQGSWRIPYQRLFVYAWNNALVMALAAVCVQLIWLVLWLWAGLFALLGVQAFMQLFSESWFAFPMTGLMVGLGVWVARTQERPIQMARLVLQALGRLVLPLMAWVLVLFALALMLTGLETLWATRFAAVLLMGVLIFHIWLVNAVYQDGSAAQGPYPQWVQHLVQASLLTMMVLATLACVAVGLRVQQYGWTAERLWAAVGSGLLWLYATGYAWAAVQSWRRVQERPWLAAISPVNRGLSLAVLAVLLALQTPVLDPDRLGARSQLAQLQSGAQSITHERLKDLKFNHGPYGEAALEELANSPLAQTEEVMLWVRQISDSASRDDVPSVHEDSEWVDVPTAQARIRTVTGPEPDADWWPWLLDQAHSRHWASECLFDSAECVLLSQDWDNDGQIDHLLCSLDDPVTPACRLTARAPMTGQSDRGAWADEGAVDWAFPESVDEVSRLIDAVRNGQLQPRPLRWPSWEADVGDAQQGLSKPWRGQLQRHR
ncbi:DUF4153 domain-containing protein [Comamonas sp. NoAH]|uniref:DUF4153 domain-containing protein n=1 Tax=Comamonas halotolerans TaxID=3041496 RepID=UPI0024E04BBB|nr:DUF4153 domain-containing protein [Comamonas sp. NoAH]